MMSSVSILPEMMLQRVGGIDIRHAGIKAAAEQRGEAGGFEFLLIGPLPVVLKLGHVTRLVVRGVDVMHTGLQAGIHDGEILIGSATLMTTSGLKLFSSFTSSGTLSASTPAVWMGRFSSAAMPSHFDFVRLASMISPKTSGSWAHLWVTTRPTPPAPMMRTR
jgi:hypothetical protein